MNFKEQIDYRLSVIKLNWKISSKICINSIKFVFSFDTFLYDHKNYAVVLCYGAVVIVVHL